MIWRNPKKERIQIARNGNVQKQKGKNMEDAAVDTWQNLNIE